MQTFTRLNVARIPGMEDDCDGYTLLVTCLARGLVVPEQECADRSRPVEDDEDV